MTEREPVTLTTTMNTVQRDLRELVKKVSKRETRVVLEEDGKAVAVLVSTDDLEQLRRLDSYRKDPWKVIDAIHARNLDKDPEEVERDVAEAIAEVRAEPATRSEPDAPK